MSFLHVITALEVGGAERMLLRLATHPDAAGRHAVVSLMGEGALTAGFRAADVPCDALNLPRGTASPTHLLRAVRRLAALIRQRRPAVVMSWLYHADLAATLALLLSGRRRRTGLVWNLRCSDMELGQYGRGTRRVQRALVALARVPDLVVANAAAGRDAHAALGYRPRGWQILPNGIDTDAFRPDPAARAAARAELGLADDTLLIGLVARVDPMKDHATFLAAAHRFAAGHPHARFLLVGEGTDGPALAALVEGGPARVLRLGRRKDVARLWNATDIATLSSAFGEGFPTALGEAMATGRACVATDVGDAASLLGPTGTIVPRRDPVALSDAWVGLAEAGAAGRDALGAAARRRVRERYGLAACVAAYHELHDRLEAERCVA